MIATTENYKQAMNELVAEHPERLVSTREIVQRASAISASDEKWWPDLFLRKGRTLVQITPEQCSTVMEIYVGDRGQSEMRKPWIDLYDINGGKIGRISYNGRVWLHDIEGDVEVPQTGVKTAAQHEAEGWKDFRP